ncbi:MAG TPA: MotA/TolQ/ExbB proton channel family protein [Chthoniobacterales bacterium]
MPYLILAELPEPANAVWRFFASGGFFMWPLLACSIVCVTTIILRGMALRRKNVLPLVIESEIERLVPGGSAERLSRIVQQDNSSLARIVRTALQHLRGPRNETVEVVETKARHELVVLEKGLIVLEVITGIAPLLGLIGAVAGLVHVFSALGISSGASNTQAVAKGIAEALNATVFGLSIAVPSLVAFSYFSKKVEVLSIEMETLVVELIGKCYFGRVHRDDAAHAPRVSAGVPSVPAAATATGVTAPAPARAPAV